jgi:Transglutaminase-like superfamily
MVCRDFSAPDHYATLFPRSQVTSLQALAQQLTSPFPSPTDKARAIFTWLHHNIRYDVDSFFNNNVRGSTPQSTLSSGLAVCEGYAALFTNLATHAGLESIVISGHGKGFGHAAPASGSPIPPFTAGHAWNAVKIDNNHWKLIDACWGAGHVQGKGLPYIQSFNPSMFTMSNEEFGLKHFPENKEHFFLPGARRMAWEDYIQPHEVEPPTIFTNARADYGIGEQTVVPRGRKLQPSQGGTVRFQFGLLCPHWMMDKHTKKGLPPVFLLLVHGVDGRNKDHIPLERVVGQTPGGGGDFWYVEVSACELGAPGQTVTLFAVTSFGDRKDARGLTVRQFREGKGRVGMGFMGVAAWDLV